MNKERLLNVAKALRESQHPDNFTMCTVHTCGTPACAIGHYASRRDLQQFLQLPTRHYETKANIYVGPNAMLIGAWGATRPTDGWGLDAQRHFEITEYQVEQLFGYDGCRGAKTANEAAEYIERFVARDA
jgi:hypothetical protein